MKNILVAIVLLSAFTSHAQGNLLALRAEGGGSNITFRINDTPVSSAELSSFLQKLRKADPSLTLQVSCQETNQAGGVMALLLHISESGFADVRLSCPVAREGARETRSVQFKLAGPPAVDAHAQPGTKAGSEPGVSRAEDTANQGAGINDPKPDGKDPARPQP